jgi:predicted DNA-binding transcriptional regulator
MMKKSKSQISVQQVKVFEFVRSNGAGWTTATDIAKSCDIAPRTARHHAAGFVRKGIFDKVETFGGYSYRMLPKPDQSYLDELEKAKEAQNG